MAPTGPPRPPASSPDLHPQLILSTTTKVIFRKHKHDHITLLPTTLDWQALTLKIKSKLLSRAYKPLCHLASALFVCLEYIHST